MPKFKDPRDAGIYTAEMGQPPDEPDMGSIRPRPRMRGIPEMQNLPGKFPPGTTLNDVLNPRMRRRGAPDMQNLPGKLPPGTTLDDLINDKMKPRQDMEMVNMRKGGSVKSASSRGDGIAQRGKTRGTLVMCGGGYMKGKK
jgi:hypothetical protein